MSRLGILAICLISLSVTCQLVAAGKCSELETVKPEVQLASNRWPVGEFSNYNASPQPYSQATPTSSHHSRAI